MTKQKQLAKQRSKLEDKQKKLDKYKEDLTFENERLQHLDLQLKEKERLQQNELHEIKIQKNEIIHERDTFFKEKEAW